MRNSALLVLIAAFVSTAGCDNKAPERSSASDADRPASLAFSKPPTRSTEEQQILLDDLIGFSDGKICEAYAITQELLTNLLVNTAKSNELALGNLIVPPRFRRAFGKPELTTEMEDGNTFYEVSVPVSGRWHGLKIVEISSSGMPESDAGAWTYRFQEPYEKVRTVLNSMGFGLDRQGNQPRDPLEDHVWTALYNEDGLTNLYCEPRGTPPTLEESNKRAAEIVGA